MELEARVQGLLRLFRHWVERNPDWDKQVTDCLNTKDGWVRAQEAVAGIGTTYFLGRITGTLISVTEEDYLKQAEQLWADAAKDKKLLGGERDWLEADLNSAIKRGMVSYAQGKIGLTELGIGWYLTTQPLKEN